MAEYVMVIERTTGSEWAWRVAEVNDDGSPGDTVDQTGFAYSFHSHREGLEGRTWTRFGARREARRALRSLRRYLNRPEPEVIRDA